MDALARRRTLRAFTMSSGGSRGRITPFKCAGQAHGALEILQMVELHVDVDMVQQTPGEELGLPV